MRRMRILRMAGLAAIGMAVAGTAFATPPPRRLPPWPLPVQLADEAPAARAVLDHLQQNLELIDADLDRIAQAADRLAAALAEDGSHACRVLGDAGLVKELTRPAAGPMAAGTPVVGEPVLYLLTNSGEPDAMRDALAECRRLRDAGHVVILAASVEALGQRQLEAAAREAGDLLLDNFEPADAGLIALDRQRRISTQTITLAVIGWTLRAELDAAVSRRARRSDAPAPGEAGQAYLDVLRAAMTDLGTASWPTLVRAAERAALAIADGGRVLAVSTQPLTAAHAARHAAGDPWLMIWAPDAAAAAHDDFVIAFGGDEAIAPADWGMNHALRRAGRGVCWVTCAFGSWDRGLRRGELRLDPRWPYGSAAEGTAGVMAETVYWLLSAAMLERLHDLGVMRGLAAAL